MIDIRALLVIESACVCRRELKSAAAALIPTMHTLALNSINSARWQRSYPGYFSFSFVYDINAPTKLVENLMQTI